MVANRSPQPPERRSRPRRSVSLLIWLAAAFLLGALVMFAAGEYGRDRAAGPAPGSPPERFGTAPPGQPLPSGKECAAWIGRPTWEPRPANAAANQRVGHTIPRIDGASAEGNRRLAGRIDGNFTGTTDAILRWGACKWGFDEDIVRAVAIQESYWNQSQLGDKENGEFQSFGILQVKRSVHEDTYPAAEVSTAFNVDYALAWRRACFEGYFRDWIPAEARGDEWGCVGLWFTGEWEAPARLTYIDQVRQHWRQQIWKAPGF